MEPMTDIDLRTFIRDIPDFPKPGIVFKDITPLLANGKALQVSVQRLAERFVDQRIDVIAAAEARGFLLAAPLAYEMGVGVVPIRKSGKLPFQKHYYSYELEYGTDTLEMHIDGIEENQRVLIVDDLLATGGTVEACCRMIEKCQAEIVACAFLVELGFLQGAERLQPYDVFSLVKFD